MKNISWLVKEIRKEQKLTQAEMAKTLGTTTQFISLVENERSGLPVPLARKLMRKYNIEKQSFAEAYVDDFRASVEAELK
jgi:DNA-binding XRE family transcriptional regulator